MKFKLLFICIFLFSISYVAHSQILFKYQAKHTFKKELKQWIWRPNKELSNLKTADSVSFYSKLFDDKVRKPGADSLSAPKLGLNPLTAASTGDLRFYKHKTIEQFTEKHTWIKIGKWSVKNSDLQIHIDNKDIYLARLRSFDEFIDFKVTLINS